MEGQTVSHYRVLEKLGGGGMGVVYKALDTRLDRHVALKFLPPELTRDDGARQRFIQEAKAASALDHPNICTIYEIDSTPDGQMFIVMAYYGGETIKRRLEQGLLPVDEALDIAIQVAKGLVKAHAAGIVHRDIKPANLMVTTDGLVKIVDFGIAKLLGQTGPTETGTTLGTVAYMAPEQINGEDADQQTDLWSLGAVLYEMLIGRAPFQGDRPVVVMNAIVQQALTPPSEVRPEIRGNVERVVTRALEKTREARYGSARELLREATDCHTALTRPVPVEAQPATAGASWLKRGVIIPAAVLVALVAAGAIWSFSRGADARWAREEAIPEIQRLIEEDDYVTAFSLAEEAERYVPHDPILADLWPEMSAIGSLGVEPPGADVYVREYGANNDAWRYLGETPLVDLRLPRGVFQWRIEKAGFEPMTLVASNPSSILRNLDELFGTLPDTFVVTPEISLIETGGTRPGMTLVPGGTTALNARPVVPVTVGPFFIDTYEVTNRDFKEFVDSGGYEQSEFWEGLEFIRDGRKLTWQEAVAEFQDLSGRPGPATWELGDYPDGQADHPVGGVSWYEAAAYAKFRGKALPTVRHWRRAALSHAELGTPLGPSVASLSNFDGAGPARVGSYEGMGPYGTYDMGGNVREWCSTTAGDHRWILGGTWNDPGNCLARLG